MLGVIARGVDVLVLRAGKEVLLYVLATALELLMQKVILPPSPLGSVPLYSPAPLRRGRTLAPDTSRVGAVRIGSHDLLDPNVVLPAVAQVILVYKPLAQTETKIC
jgi:hypothetical protein